MKGRKEKLYKWKCPSCGKVITENSEFDLDVMKRHHLCFEHDVEI